MRIFNSRTIYLMISFANDDIAKSVDRPLIILERIKTVDIFNAFRYTQNCWAFVTPTFHHKSYEIIFMVAFFLLFLLLRSTVISSLSSNEAVDLKYARVDFCMGHCYNFCRWHRPSCVRRKSAPKFANNYYNFFARQFEREKERERRMENGQKREQTKQKKTIGDYIDAVDSHRHRHRYTLWAKEWKKKPTKNSTTSILMHVALFSRVCNFATIRRRKSTQNI